MRARSRLTFCALGVIAVAAAVLRAVAAAGHSAHVSADQHAYTALARAIAEHARYSAHGLSGAFHWPPGAPALFAVADRVGGTSAGPYVAQVVVGTATVLAAAWVARQAGGPVAMLVAAAAVAFYPPLIMGSAELLSEPLGALLVTVAIGAAGWGLRSGRAVRMIPCGVALGLLILTRADQLLAPAVVAIVVAALLRSRRGWVSAGVVAAAALATATPWLVYVAASKHAFVPVSTGGGSNLFIGTYLPGHGTIFGLKHALGPAVRAQVPSLRGVPDFKLSEGRIVRWVARGHRGSGEDAWLRSRGLANAGHYITQRPLAFGGMLAAKVGRLWGDYTHGSLHRSKLPLRIGHLLLLFVALGGLVAALVRIRPPAVEIVATAALLALATLVNAVLVSEPRHLLPLLPLLFASGAVGIARGR
jgi:4-amino-4-deoxy-L-arabinose transferase-like glycosyltransferase